MCQAGIHVGLSMSEHIGYAMLILITMVLFVFQWSPREGSAPISHATFSCDSQLIYATFLDATVCIFNAARLKLRCRILPAAYLPATVRYDEESIHVV